MTLKSKITKKNLRMLCWRAGYEGVTGVSKAIGKSRISVHRAVVSPNSYKPTMKLLQEVLL